METDFNLARTKRFHYVLLAGWTSKPSSFELALIYSNNSSGSRANIENSSRVGPREYARKLKDRDGGKSDYTAIVPCSEEVEWGKERNAYFLRKFRLDC